MDKNNFYDNYSFIPPQEYEFLTYEEHPDMDYDSITRVKDFFLKFMNAEDFPVSNIPTYFDEDKLDFNSKIPQMDYDILDANDDLNYLQEKGITATKKRDNDDSNDDDAK